jgi:hypothetical protein
MVERKIMVLKHKAINQSAFSQKKLNDVVGAVVSGSIGKRLSILHRSTKLE